MLSPGLVLCLIALCCSTTESAGNLLPVRSKISSKVSCTAPGAVASDQIRSIIRNKVLPALDCPFVGACRENPAASCKQVVALNPRAPSGDYWVQKCDESTVQVYCDMDNRRCCNSTAGWMRVANLNMTRNGDQCPYGWGLRLAVATKPSCEKKIGASCASYFYSTHGIPYSRVCGRVIAYQDGTPDGFGPYFFYGLANGYTIDDNYLDGISLTHGHSPRKHVWTFVAARGDAGAHDSQVCPCLRNITSHVPPFVGNDYFCDSASHKEYRLNYFYPDDPLWDGQGCNPTIECCQYNNPPWFCKQLPQETRDELEMRTCANGGQNDEEVAVGQIELFVL